MKCPSGWLFALGEHAVKQPACHHPWGRQPLLLSHELRGYHYIVVPLGEAVLKIVSDWAWKDGFLGKDAFCQA